MVDAEDTEPTQVESQLYRYWFNCIMRSKKQHRTKQWDEATKRTQCKDKDNLPYVNGLRKLYEGLKSFLDQKEPSFRVLPTKPFTTDQIAIKKAECNEVYLKTIWAEQKCQVSQSQKLDSALQKNVGFTCLAFDKKKWMPKIKYRPATSIFLDPDCGGIRQNANWEGYFEEISLEQLKASFNLSDAEIGKIKSSAGSVLSKKEQDDIKQEGDKKLYTTVEIYHIFARNDAAIRLHPEEVEAEEKLPPKSIVEELELTTPKRYLQFVKGYHKPLYDGDWPYELDDDEFPTTMLRLNTPVESLYGFTDNEQMKRLDEACDFVMGDIQLGAYWAGNKKFVGRPEAADLVDVDIQKFLNDPKTCYLPKLLDSEGKPKIAQIAVGDLNPELIQAYKVLNEGRHEATLLGELLDQKISEYKDVTAFSARVHEANAHQKINRRLGGPEGYEASIQEDAVKMLEIAHQFVPKLSVVEMPEPVLEADEFGEPTETGETELKLIDMPWTEASKAILQPDARLVKLGVDAIVGPELAEFWDTADEYSAKYFKLSTAVQVVPGSTRSITKEQRAAMIAKYYTEIFSPLYVAMGRFDLAFQLVSRIGQLAGIENIDDYIPSQDEIKRFMEEQKQMMQAQAEQGEQMGLPGGMPQAQPQAQVQPQVSGIE